MKNIFIDTSSILKIYHRETDTDDVLEILSNTKNIVYLSELAKVEFRSAVWKKIREGELNEIDGIEIVACFQNDFPKYEWIKVDSDIINTAENFFHQYGKMGLRTLDSIQLSCAVSIKEQADEFLTSDKILKTIFLKEGLKLAT